MNVIYIFFHSNLTPSKASIQPKISSNYPIPPPWKLHYFTASYINMTEMVVQSAQPTFPWQFTQNLSRTKSSPLKYNQALFLKSTNTKSINKHLGVKFFSINPILSPRNNKKDPLFDKILIWVIYNLHHSESERKTN